MEDIEVKVKKKQKVPLLGRYKVVDDGEDHTPVYKQGIDRSLWNKPVPSSKVKYIKDIEGN
jgi:hypothetical protein